MRHGVNGRQGAVALEEVPEDVVEVWGLLGVSFGAVGALQPAHGVDGDAVGSVANYVAWHGAYISLDLSMVAFFIFFFFFFGKKSEKSPP